MKRIIAIVLALLMCFALVACGKNRRNENALSPEEITDLKSQLVGDWYDVGVNGGKISFNSNGTGKMDTKDSKADFTWSYDNTAGSLYVRISGKNFNIKLVNNGNLTYLDMLGAWFFKEADTASGKELVLAERRGGISKEIEGKDTLTAGLEVKLNDTLGVKINSIEYADGKLALEMTLKNNSSSATSLENISELIYVNKTKFYMADIFATVKLDTLGLSPAISATELSAGETLSVSLNLFSMDGFENIAEHYGEVNAYRSIMLGKSEYYINIGAYVK